LLYGERHQTRRRDGHPKRDDARPPTLRLYAMAAVAAVAIVVGFVVDTWELESPVSLPDVPGWVRAFSLVLFLVVTFKRDRDSSKHVVLTGAALAVLFAAGLALVAAATL